MPPCDPADERPHPPGPEQLWGESWYFDWFRPDGGQGGYVRIGTYPNLGVTWYWACLVEEGQPLVTVIDHEVPLPRAGSLELRSSGLWADHKVEEPLEHLSIDLEAFALVLDRPTDVYHGPRGERVAFGFELDFETDGGAYAWPPVTPRYEIPCRVHGEVQVGQRRIEVDGWGQRDHSWGVRDWWERTWCWSAGRLDDGLRWHSAGGFAEGVDVGFGYVRGPGDPGFTDVTALDVVAPPGPEGLPAEVGVALRGGGAPLLELVARPVAWSPVLCVAPDGRRDRFPRALCRVEGPRGPGVGWVELNQPEDLVVPAPSSG